MKKNTSKKQAGASRIDIILLVVILGSVGFIGYRILGPSSPVPSTGTARTTSPTSPIPNSTPVVVDNPAQPPIPTVEDSEWKQIISDPVLNAARVKRADGCAELGNHRQWGFWTNNAARIKQIEDGKPQTFWGLKDFQCIEVEQPLPLVVFSEKADEPVVQYLNTMKVADIISIEIRKIPDAYYKSQNSSVELFEQYLAPKRNVGPGARDNIIRLVPITGTAPAKPDAQTAPAIVPYGKVIHKEVQEAFLKSHPQAVIVDVRSTTEFANGSLPGAINIPFTPAPRKESAFSWDVKNSDLAESKFDVSQIYPKFRGRPVIIVGSQPGDGRAFWAMTFLSRLAGNQIYLLYGGV